MTEQEEKKPEAPKALTTQPTSFGEMQTTDAFCDLAGASNLLSQISSTYSFLNVFDIEDALSNADWDVKKEIREYVNLVRDPDCSAKYKMMAMRELRSIATQAIRETNILSSATLKKTAHTDEDGITTETFEQSVTVPINAMRTQAMLQRNAKERESRNQVSVITKETEATMTAPTDGASRSSTETTSKGNNENGRLHAGNPDSSQAELQPEPEPCGTRAGGCCGAWSGRNAGSGVQESPNPVAGANNPGPIAAGNEVADKRRAKQYGVESNQYSGGLACP